MLEPRRENNIGLNRVNMFRKSLEANLWVLPAIKKISKSHQVSIFPEDPFTDIFLQKRKIIPLEVKNPEISLEHALKESINLSREWHSYGKLPTLLQIGGINVGEVIQHKMIQIFFNIFKHIEVASIILKREKPNDIYLQNDVVSTLQAFHAVVVDKGIEHHFIEPKVYSKLKNQVKLYLNIKNFEKEQGPFNLYSITNMQNKESKYKILLDTPYISYLNAAFPATLELSNQNICKCYVIGKETDISKKFSNLKRLDVGSFDKNKYKEKTRALRTYYRSQLKEDATFQNIFEYRGIKIWDIIKDEIKYFFDAGFNTLAFGMTYFQRVIDTVKPDILIVGDDRATPVRGHVLVAKRKGIPVLEIQHGMIIIQATPMDTPLSDKLAAGGDYSKDVYTNYGSKKEQIIVTGWPKFDTYVKLKKSLAKRHNGTDILFATQPMDTKLILDSIDAIGSFIEDSTHFRLIIKPHPTESIKIYNPIIKKYKNVILHKSSDDFSSLIVSSDILVTLISTVAIEAAVLDKPIICIDTSNKESMFASSGIAIEVKNLEELIPAIKDVLYNEDTRQKLAEARAKFVYEHAYKQDGNASERVANLIVQMIEESRRNVKRKLPLNKENIMRGT
jgi:UDP-N-acetylglucosamine 2-epimerase